MLSPALSTGVMHILIQKSLPRDGCIEDATDQHTDVVAANLNSHNSSAQSGRLLSLQRQNNLTSRTVWVQV